MIVEFEFVAGDGAVTWFAAKLDAGAVRRVASYLDAFRRTGYAGEVERGELMVAYIAFLEHVLGPKQWPKLAELDLELVELQPVVGHLLTAYAAVHGALIE